jgi:hypothetical protein
LERRLKLIDDLLDVEMASAMERRALLIDHARLAGAAEFVLHLDKLQEDEKGLAFLPLPNAGRAYDVDDFVAYLRLDAKRLQRLADCVTDALFIRFSQDVAAEVLR